MGCLTNPSFIKQMMRKYDFYLKKDLGQNFLIDGYTAQKIADALECSKDSIVLEVGPGIGAITELLAPQCEKLLAVEIDPFAVKMLEDIFSSDKNVQIIHKDILKTDLRMLVGEYIQEGRPVRAISNLPYYITSPVLMYLLESKIAFSEIVVMLQKEVAQRLYSKPSSKAYSAFTIAVEYYAKIEYLFDVPNTVFMPSPKVDSAVLRLRPRKTPLVRVKDEKIFFKTVRAGFAMRRKTLLNCISAGFSLPKDQTREILSDAEIGDSVRAETLSIAQFGRLSDIIYDTIHKA